jgi:hypothetical protein
MFTLAKRANSESKILKSFFESSKNQKQADWILLNN